MVRHGAKGETRRHQEAEGGMSSNSEEPALRRRKAIEMTTNAHGARSALTAGFGIMLVMTLSGCSEPISEGATKAMIERCKELGMATYVRNTGLDSTVSCVQVKKEQ